MKLDQLLYFVEAGRHESVGRAARVLCISPSAISHSIASLEKEFGVALFTRERKRIFLTTQGKMLLERAKFIQNELLRLRQDLIAPKISLTGYFRIAGTHSIATQFITPAWSRMTKNHPEVSGEVLTGRTVDLISRVAQGEMDLAICFGPQPLARVTSKILAVEELVIVVRRGHPILTCPLKARAKEIQKYRACLPKSFQGRGDFESHPALEELGIEPSVDFLYDSYEIGIRRVLDDSSWTWTLLPKRLLSGFGKKLREVHLTKWSALIDIRAIWPKNRQPDRAILLLIAEIEKIVQARV